MVKKTIAAIFSVLVLSSVLTACNTTRGVGEDIKAAVTLFLVQQQKHRINSGVNGRYGTATVPSACNVLKCQKR